MCGLFENLVMCELFENPVMVWAGLYPGMMFSQSRLMHHLYLQKNLEGDFLKK